MSEIWRQHICNRHDGVGHKLRGATKEVITDLTYGL